jgi:ferric-chelate reductase
LFNVAFFKGRPDLLAAVKEFVGFDETVKTGLIVCGPSSMSHDVGKAAVSAQQQIIKSEIGSGDIWFHAESFS